MAQELNVGLAFLAVARERPDAVAMRDAHTAVTYGQLAGAVMVVADRLRRHGAVRGRTMAVRTDDPVVVFTTLFGSALTGARWIAATWPAMSANPDFVDLVFDSGDAELAKLSGAIPIDASWMEPLAATPAPFSGPADPDEPWLVLATSGTTGTPKRLGISHRIALRRIAADKEWFDRPGRKAAGLFPVTAAPAISRYLSALVRGGEVVISADPQFWLEQRVDYVFASPAQIRKAMGDVVLPEKLPLLHVFGATAPESLIRHLLQSFEKVANGYGSTETHTCLAIFREVGPDGTLTARTVTRDVEIQIVDENDTPLPRGEEGIVRIRSACAVDGYLDNPQATAATFRDGYFYPGDLGRWQRDGNFLVTGRVNDQFNLGGVKLNAALLDAALQNVPGIEDAVVFLLPQEDGSEALRAMVRLASGMEADKVLLEARLALMRVGGRAAVPERFLFTDMVPRNPSGKPDRQACVRMVMERRAARRGGHNPHL